MKKFEFKLLSFHKVMDEEIIEEIKNHRILYDPSLPDYKNVLLKDRIWKGIATRLGCSDDYVKRRWKGIRDTYNRNKQRVHLRSLTISPEDCTPKWKNYSLLNFLDDVASTRDPLGKNAMVPEDSSSATPSHVQNATANENTDLTSLGEPVLKKRREEPVREPNEDKFLELLDIASKKISEKYSNKASKTSTSILFDALAERVQRANLTERQIIHIENAVCQLISAKLEEYVT